MPYIINAFVGSNISSNVLEGAGWRWGCTSSVHISSSCLTHIISDGMFAILVPVSLAPLIITLLWAERKARKMNIVSTKTDAPKLSFFARTILVAEQLDVLGLLLIGTSVALILLPLTLTNSAKGGWKNGACYHQICLCAFIEQACSFYDRYDCRWGRAYPRVRAVGLQIRQIPRHPTPLCGQPKCRPRQCDWRI